MRQNIKVLKITASGQIKTGRGKFWGLIVQSAAAVTTAIAYDNTSAAGAELMALSAVIADSEGQLLPFPVDFSTGLYVAVTGAGVKAFAYYE